MKIFGNSGYVGLVILLITTAVLVYLIWKVGFVMPGRKTERTVPTAEFQVLDKAQDLKVNLEQKYR